MNIPITQQTNLANIDNDAEKEIAITKFTISKTLINGGAIPD
ncbi:hypothetical protein PG357_06595 [Riemerella anatipestifer]|nr:hypothetical protein [Riemerella anatipestifer]